MRSEGKNKLTETAHKCQNEDVSCNKIIKKEEEM